MCMNTLLDSYDGSPNSTGEVPLAGAGHHTAQQHLLAGSTTSRHPAFSCLSAAKCQLLPSGAVTVTLDSCTHAAALLLLMLPFLMRFVQPLLLALLRRPCASIPTVTAASSPSGESATEKWWATLLQNQQCSVR